MTQNRLVTRTTFRKVPMPEFDEKGPVFEWFWTTRSPNNEAVGGSSGEGYKELRGAVNGFFAQQGLPDWEPQEDEDAEFVVPDGYSGYWAGDLYVVDKFATE
jgi:hypothetical protein